MGIKKFLPGARHYAIAIAALALMVSTAQALEKIVFTLPWSIGGSTGPLFLAVDRGYFAEAGIDLQVAAGNGSANVATRIASGAFQAGIGDLTSVVKFNTQNPDKRLIGLYSQTPADLTIVTLKSSGISKPDDLRGKILGAPLGDAAYKLFAAFSATTKVTAADVKWEHMAPNVREVMLIQKKVDAITANEATAYFALKSAGIPDSDIVFLRYADYGVKLIGTGLMTSEALIKAKPDLVRGMVRALNRGWMDAMKDPGAAVDAALKREPLLKRQIEVERLEYAIRAMLSQPDVQAGGLGYYDDKTAAYNIDLMSDYEQLPTKISVQQFIDSSFLPPKSERIPPSASAAK